MSYRAARNTGETRPKLQRKRPLENELTHKDASAMMNLNQWYFADFHKSHFKNGINL